KIWVAVLLALGALIALVTAVSAVAAPVGAAVGAGDIQRLSIAEAGYPSSAAIRFPTWLLTLVSGLLTLALPTAFLIGLVSARHRVLEEPSRRLPLLRRIAGPGSATGWLTGAALALQHVGAVDLAPEAVLSGLHFSTGIFAGVGYAALFGLIAHRITARGA